MLSLTTRTCIIALVGIVLLALVLRVGAVHFLSHDPGKEGIWYHRTATVMTQGHGYADFITLEPTAWRPVGYTVMVAAVYWLTDGSWYAAGMMNAVVGTLCVILTYALAHARLPPKWALLPAFLMAVWPSYLGQYTAMLYVETTLTLAVLLCLLAIDRAVRSPGVVNFAIVGAAVGLSVYFKSLTIPLILLAGGLAVIRRRRIRHLLLVPVALAAMFAVLSPWLVRNHIHYDALIIAGTYSGYNFSAAMNADETRGGGFNQMYPPGKGKYARTITQASGRVRETPPHMYERYWLEYGFRDGLAHFRDDPRAWVLTRDAALLNLWLYQTGEYDQENLFPERVRPHVQTMVEVTVWPWLAALLTAGFGFAWLLLCWGWRRWLEYPNALLPAVLLYWTAVHILLFAAPRHNQPMTPIVLILAAYVVMEVCLAVKHRNRRPRPERGAVSAGVD